MKKKLSSTEEVNKYYSIVNGLVNNYINDHKVSPKQLKKFFSNKNKRDLFFEKNQLSNIDKIDVIFNDVIDDHVHMQDDNISKFESFTLNEQLNLEKPDINYEKILADYYHISVGHIELKDESNHIYKVKNFDKEQDVLILSREDAIQIKRNISKVIIENLLQQEIDHNVVKGVSLKINLNDVVDKDLLEKKVKKSIGKLLIIKYVEASFGLKYKRYFKSHFIFE